MAAPKLTIQNGTKYRTDDIRRIVRAAMKALGVRAAKRVIVKPSRKHFSGRANVGSRTREAKTIWIWLPPHFNAKEAACLAAHELSHTQGVCHGDMTREQYMCRQEVPWAKGLQLRTRITATSDVKAVETPAQRARRIVEKRSTHADDMHRKALTRLKRAQNIERKWRKQVQYYRKRQTALASEETARRARLRDADLSVFDVDEVDGGI